MKRFPQIDRFFTAVCSFAILALLILLTSCEKESLSDDFTRVKASNSTTASLKTLIVYNDCSSTCIEEGSETYYVKSDSKSETSGSNTKAISYSAYNTETQFVVEVIFDIQGPSNSKANITIDIEGDGQQFDNVEKGDMVFYTIDLPEGWQACDEIQFSINANFNQGNGRSNNENDIDFINIGYSLIGICASSCDESFSYEEKQDQNGRSYYTFTYVSREDLNGANVKFTCPHITDFEALDGKEYEVNPGKSNGSQTVLNWTGDIQACNEITFTIAFDADCPQNNSGKVNLFTDFKVNDESKKGDNENIVYQCPE